MHAQSYTNLCICKFGQLSLRSSSFFRESHHHPVSKLILSRDGIAPVILTLVLLHLLYILSCQASRCRQSQHQLLPIILDHCGWLFTTRGKNAASVGDRQSSLKRRNDGFSFVTSCRVFQYAPIHPIAYQMRQCAFKAWSSVCG